MPTNQVLKKHLFSYCTDYINLRIGNIKKRLTSIQESRDNETKSSAGDKFETGRAMMQIEEDKSRSQLIEAEKVKAELSKIDINKSSDKIKPGSLVTTDKGIYFISIGIGKVIFEDNIYYCLSVNSPIGNLLRTKTIGDQFQFRDEIFSILDVK